MTVIQADPPVRAIHRIDRIIIGERGDRDLCGLDELKASIAAEGLVHPLILTPDRHLVLGARRLEACRQLGWTDIPAMTVTGIWQALDYLEYEQRDDRCLKPLTVHEAMGMNFALRELKWWPKVYPAPGTPATGQDVSGARRRRIAVLLGLNQRQYMDARVLWQAARGYRGAPGDLTPVSPATQDQAAALVAGILSPADIHGAYKKYRRIRTPPDGPPPPGPAPVRSTRGDGRRSPQRDQATQIQQGLASITGTLAALMSIHDVDPAVPADQLDNWAGDITGMRRDLTTFLRRLKKGQE